MVRAKRVYSVFLVAVMALSILLAGGTTAPVEAAGSAVTMAAFGERIRMPGMTNNGISYGDTWDTAWRANDEVYVQLNDGNGFSGTNYQHSKIGRLNGTPENPSSLSGVDLNPGTLGSTIGSTYSTGIYEVDGALYFIPCYSAQIPGAWKFYNTSILKSTDGGANWINHLGQTNVIPPNDENCTFPDDDVSDFSFVKYGKGGVAPAIDNAQTYVYLITPSACMGADYYLARIKRSDLSAWTTTFDRTKVQYYKGGDGMLDTSWTGDSNQVASIYHDNTPVNKCGPANIVYNYGLQRYIMTSQYSDSWANPKVHSTLFTYEAPQPWGPWTKILEENVNNKDSANLTWPYLMQKFTSTDGKKMWLTVCGEIAANNPLGVNEYLLQFKPLYLTTNPVSTYQAEGAALTGTSIATGKAGYEGSGYVTGFDTVGDKCQFTVNAGSTGAYILKFRYNTNAYQQLSCYVNGVHKEDLKLGAAEQMYATWTEYTLFAWLNSGSNTVTFQYDSGDSGNVNLDSLKFALYSTTAGSLPGANPPGTQTPYGGTNWSLPGTIQAENFDVGGEGTAYHDNEPANQGGAAYRPSEGVDIEACSDTGGGYDICWTMDGEWLEYTVNIPSGNYNFKARVASQAGGGSITAKLDGTTLGTVSVPATGGWQSWQDVTLNNVNVSGGNGKVLRLEITNGSFNLNSISFTASASGPAFNTTYKIVNRDNGKVMGIENNSLANNAKNDQYAWVPAPSQYWTLEDAGSGMVKIKNNNSGKYLGIADNSTSAGAYNDQYTWGGYASQYWKIEDVGSGWYRIVNNNSGMVLQPEGNSSANNAKIVQQPWNSSNNCQYWKFETP